LRVTHELVKLHGGSITFSSLPGLGATFHIYLPRLAHTTRDDRPPAAPSTVLPGAAQLSPQVNELTRQAVMFLEQSFADQSLSRTDIARRLSVSDGYLTLVFRRDLGITPREYLGRYRIERAKLLLQTTNLSVTEIANQVGFNDGAYFSRVFHQETGRCPLAFRRQSG
jgi:AraC-like DNA-binding protein